MLAEIQNLLPELYQSLVNLDAHILSNDFQKYLEFEYSRIKGISIDYGVMEKSQNVFTIRSNFGWSDLGSWDEIYNLKDKDANGNVKFGRTVTINTKNCLILNDKIIVATVGVEDLLIVNTEDGLLICKRGDSQNVKEVTDYLKRKGLDEFI